LKRHFGLVEGNDVLDCTGVTASPPEIEEIAAIDRAAAIINPNIRIAMVATLPEVVVAANACANDTLTIYPTGVFCSMADARAWLGLSQA
jgi:hypothetical protein